ncbi:MAG: tandem-95 repeat protein [Caldilineaceae bacterium]|nr:tandem-95 repeat protein [Caldilineaceae bacterium]
MIHFIKAISFALLLTLVFAVGRAAAAGEPPPLPHSFYGTVQVDGGNVPLGTVISAWVNDTQVAATAIFIEDGQTVYTLDVPGDRPATTDLLEGGVDGDTIRFRIEGEEASQIAIFATGMVDRLDLSLFSEQLPTAAFTVDSERNVASYENGADVIDYSSAFNTITNGPSRAIDANPSSFWRSKQQEPTNQWLKVQLVHDEIHVIDRIVLQSTGSVRGLQNFEVLVSVNGSNDSDFVPILAGALPQDNQPHSFSIAPVQARYVMLRALDNWGSADGLEVAHFQVLTRQRDGGLVSMYEGLPAFILDASSQHGSAINAINDSSSSSWRSSTPAAGQWIRVGLGGASNHTIDRMRIQSNSASETVDAFEIRVWDSTDADPASAQVFTFTGAANTEMQEFSFPPLAARVVELYVHSVHGGSVVRINSFQVLTTDGVNVARSNGVGAHVTEASTGASSAHQAIDFSDSTQWTTTSATNQWITVRLIDGEIRLIDRISLLGGSIATASPRAFEIRVSTTGLAESDFTTVFAGVSSVNTQPNVYIFEPVHARYVQLYIHNNHGYSSTQVRSFRVFAVDEGGATVPLSDRSSDTEGEVVSWHWDFGDGTSSSEQHPIHTYAMPGVYAIQLTVTNSAGTTNMVTIPYTVLPTPTVDFTWDPAREGVGNRFYDASVAAKGALVAWRWRFPEATNTTKNPTNILFIDNGDWPVDLTVTDSRLMQATLTKTVHAINLPPIYEQSGNRTVPWGNIWRANAYVNDPSPVDAQSLVCEWNFGDGQIGRIDPCPPGEGEMDYAHEEPGIYDVIYMATDKDGGSTTRSMRVTVTRRPTLVKSQVGAPDRGRNEVTVTAHLLDAMRPKNPIHTPLAGKPLIFDNGASSITVVTAEDGTASAVFPIHDGLFNVTVRFEGDDFYEPNSNSYSVDLANPLPKGDIVFIFDESLSMNTYQTAVKNRVTEIVDQLGNQIDYQLGLVGYGATELNNGAKNSYTANSWTHDNTARVLLPLIHDADKFKAVMNDLSSVGGREAGFHATVVGSSDQMIFRADAAACIILVTDENASSNILPHLPETQADALAALAERNAIFYGIFNPAFANATNDFQPLAALNGGGTFDLRTFVANASPVLATIVDNCAQYVRQTVIPDLAVEMSADAATARSGDLLTYTMIISNVGTLYAPNVLISHLLPGEVTFVSASDSGSVDDNEVTWPIFSMIAGDTVTRTLTVQVRSGLPSSTDSMTAMVSVFDTTFATQDQDPSNNVASVTTTLLLNQPPVATDDEATTDQGTPLEIDVLTNDSDPDGDDLTIISVGVPGHGTAVVGSSSSVVYTPDAGFHGMDSFTYTISDGELEATATVTVIVLPVNYAPVADDQHVSLDEDGSIAITLTASDMDGDALSFSVVTAPLYGTLSGEAPDLLYTPTADFHGTDSFTFVANDGEVDSNLATVTITVHPVNDAPMATDDEAITDEDTPVEIDVLANDSDVDGDDLTIIAVGMPGHGAAVVSGPSSVVYTPTLDFHGTDVFTYTVSDGELEATATVTVIVLPVNDAPIAMDDEADTGLDQQITIAVLENDYDVDDDPISVVSISQPVTGTATLHADGTVTYTPATGFRGTDHFTYTISDGELSATATVIVHVVLPPVIVCKLYPIALHAATVAGATPGAALPDVFNGTGPGNFGWLSWTGNPNTPTLVNNLTPPGGSHTYVNPHDPADTLISTGDWVRGSPGVANAKPVRDALDALLGQEIVVPVWDGAQGQGNNAQYRVADFARIRITGYQLPGQNRISAVWLGRAFCGETDLLRAGEAQAEESTSLAHHLLYLPQIGNMDMAHREDESDIEVDAVEIFHKLYLPAVIR